MHYTGSSDWEVTCKGCPVETKFWISAKKHGYGEGENAEAVRRWNQRSAVNAPEPTNANWQHFLRCKFCGKRAWEVAKMIAGPDYICICDECTRLAMDIVNGTTAADIEYESWGKCVL